MGKPLDFPALMVAVYSLYFEAAEKGAPCPSIGFLERHLNVSNQTVHRVNKRLEDAGRIMRLGGPDHTRKIKIVDTGRCTGPVGRARANVSPLAPREDWLPQELQEAKSFLMRTYPVHRADKHGGPEDRWVVGRLGSCFTDADLIELARTRGWQQSERQAA